MQPGLCCLCAVNKKCELLCAIGSRDCCSFIVLFMVVWQSVRWLLRTATIFCLLFWLCVCRRLWWTPYHQHLFVYCSHCVFVDIWNGPTTTNTWCVWDVHQSGTGVPLGVSRSPQRVRIFCFCVCVFFSVLLQKKWHGDARYCLSVCISHIFDSDKILLRELICAKVEFGLDFILRRKDSGIW